MLVTLITFFALFGFFFGWYLAIRSDTAIEAFIGILTMFLPTLALFWLLYSW